MEDSLVITELMYSILFQVKDALLCFPNSMLTMYDAQLQGKSLDELIALGKLQYNNNCILLQW